MGVRNDPNRNVIAQAVEQVPQQSRLASADIAGNDGDAGTIGDAVFEYRQPNLVSGTQIQIAWIRQQRKGAFAKAIE
jgi:hypothetical protein